ncbi:DUF2306 domain-containing protein [Maribacter halichondriae]|uniref:DUF2306 domain-containing protein n=1 Tax=Maribacter halichondriae TaxID=2980554 RepID=UPI0023583C71|nr:DUF2306 domain-containing protein [Maribacter sp. Hal144]
MNTTNRVAWVVFVVLAISVGLYPLLYLFIDREFGLLASKNESLLSNIVWNIGFYGHILFGGLALLIGWIQFSKKLRNANLERHRNIGKVYVVSAVISGLCGVYIGFYATGGLISSFGFISLGLIWLYTTTKAYFAVRKGDLQLHQGLMIYSYAACFAAVTLRIWLPLLSFAFGDFIIAYRLVAWLCWVPNIIFAYVWVHRKGLTLG